MNIQRYIEQLIEDINRASWRVKPPSHIWDSVDTGSELEMEDISFVEKHYYGEELPISQITGIDQDQLPPLEYLSDEHRALLATKLETLLENFHFKLEFPEKVPAHERYFHIYNLWGERHVAMSFGTNHIQFCDMEEEEYCPFPEYCEICREVAEQMRYDEEQQRKIQRAKDTKTDTDDELPF